jgi:hypothetical protein
MALKDLEPQIPFKTIDGLCRALEMEISSTVAIITQPTCNKNQVYLSLGAQLTTKKEMMSLSLILLRVNFLQ